VVGADQRPMHRGTAGTGGRRSGHQSTQRSQGGARGPRREERGRVGTGGLSLGLGVRKAPRTSERRPKILPLRLSFTGRAKKGNECVVQTGEASGGARSPPLGKGYGSSRVEGQSNSRAFIRRAVRHDHPCGSLGWEGGGATYPTTQTQTQTPKQREKRVVARENAAMAKGERNSYPRRPREGRAQGSEGRCGRRGREGGTEGSTGAWPQEGQLSAGLSPSNRG